MKSSRQNVDLSRRAFVINGALVMGFAMLPSIPRAFADTEVDTLGTEILAPDLPGSLRATPYLDAWIRIDAKDGITVYTGKVELGTGVKTALLQIAAERLEVSPGLIRFSHRRYCPDTQ